MNEAICLAALANLRVVHWRVPRTRMDYVGEALWQALFVLLFICFLRLPEIEQLSDLTLPFGVAAGGFAMMLFYGLSRNLPMGERSRLRNAVLIVLAGATAALFAHFWADRSPPLAAISGLLFALFLSTPTVTHLHEPVATRSRAEFAAAAVTNRLLFGLSLSLVLFGTKPDFWMYLATIVLLMLAISAIRIWRWQASPAPTADETA